MYLDPALPEPLRQHLADAVQREFELSTSVTPNSLTPVAYVVMLRDGRDGLWWSTRSALLLPEAIGTPGCIKFLQIKEGEAERVKAGEDPRAVLTGRGWNWWRAPVGLSGCGLYAAFGQPGRAIQDWLTWTGFAFASSHSPIRPGLPLRTARPFDSLGEQGIGIKALACRAGRLEACRDVLENGAGKQIFRAERRLPGMAPEWTSPDAFGFEQSGLLWDMVTDIGAEQFARFWTSDLPLEAAFELATGGDLLEWTSEWAKHNVDPVFDDPRPTPATAGMALLLVVFGLGVGVLRARK
jgi:hypothetical protein